MYLIIQTTYCIDEIKKGYLAVFSLVSRVLSVEAPIPITGRVV